MSSIHDGSSCTGGKGKEDFTRVLVTAYLLSHPSQPPSMGPARELLFHLTFSRASASPLLLPLLPWLSYIILGPSWFFSLLLGSFLGSADFYFFFAFLVILIILEFKLSAAYPSPALNPRGKKGNRGPQLPEERSGLKGPGPEQRAGGFMLC